MFEVSKIISNTSSINTIKISGAKNAILPLVIAKLLVPGKTTFNNIPLELEDLKKILDIIIFLGLKVEIINSSLVIINNGIKNLFVDNNLTKYSRYSSLLLGIFSRFKYFKIGWPGGCNISGNRPLDIHFNGFETFGFDIKYNEDYIEMNNINYKNNLYEMRFPSVGATFNMIFYAVQQKTFNEIKIKNVAIEPEIENVILFLKKAGHKINLYKRKREIVIYKANNINEVENFDVLPDRIEAITYCILSAILRKNIILDNINLNSIKNSLRLLTSIGIKIEYKNNNQIIVFASEIKNIKSKKITFKPYPGLPTDIQPLISVLLCFANSKSVLIDEVYPNRIEYIQELNKSGLNIKAKNGKIEINPINTRNILVCNFTATDIRGGMACLLLASFLVDIKDCKIRIYNIYQIMRGYNNLMENFKKFNINIEALNFY